MQTSVGNRISKDGTLDENYHTKQNNDKAYWVWCMESVTLSSPTQAVSSALALIGKTDSRHMKTALGSIALINFYCI